MALSEIVNVQIQAGTVQPYRVGFGTPLFLSYHTAWSGDEVRTYTTFAGVAADFASTTMAYKWAANVFSQNPRPDKIKIGRLPAPSAVFHTQVLDFTDWVSGTDIAGTAITPDGTTHTIAITWTTNIATTLDLLKTALDAYTGVGTCTVASPLITVPLDVPGLAHFDFTSSKVYVRDTSASFGYETALDLAVTLDADFYVVCADCNSPKNMDKIARWALANDRFAFFAPQYVKPTQFVTGEFSAGGDYTALEANDSAAGLFTKDSRLSFKEAGWIGDMLPRDPGSATWAYKTLRGIGADSWTATERTAIEAFKGNHYSAEAGVAVTRQGQSFGGEWIDVTIGLAWLTARMEERLFGALVNNPKIPYTDAGFAILVTEVRAQLRIAEAAGVLAPGWTVTILPVASQDSADRAARIVRGLEFQAQLAGAVHKINVNGTVTA